MSEAVATAVGEAIASGRGRGSQMWKHEDIVEWLTDEGKITPKSSQAEVIAAFAANRNAYRRTERYHTLVEGHGATLEAERAAAKEAKAAERAQAREAKAAEKAAAKAAADAAKPAPAAKATKATAPAAPAKAKRGAKAAASTEENPFE